MVLLSEQERLYADELQLLSDAGPYTQTSTANWTTKKTITFTLSKAQILMLKATVTASPSGAGGAYVYGAGRITVDALPVWSTGGMHGASPNDVTITSPDIYIPLAAGSHTVNFDLSCWKINGAAALMYLADMYAGQLNFRDLLSLVPTDSDDVAVSNETKTIIDKTVVIPAGRALPIGTLTKYSAFIHVVILDNSGSPTRKTRMKNVGDGNDAGMVNATLWINSAQVSWITRANDDADGDATNPTYGRGAEGYYYATVSPDQTLDVTVKANWTGTGNVRCYLAILLCPWILIPSNADYSFVSLSFSQGSTFYVVLEPLYVDSVKASKIGGLRFKSFGDATDYYSSASGTGILTHSYTFETIDVPSSTWLVNPSSAIVCISQIGVDTR